MGLKSWSGQLDDYQKELTSLSSNISNAENRLKSMQGNVNTEADVAEYNKLYDNYEALVNDYNSLVNEYNRVREKYAVGVDQYRSILNSGMDRAEAAAKEIKKLEAENSRLQQQVDLIKAYDTSGLDMTGTYAEPIEAEIRRNAQRIKELRAEENQNKMQYYSSLALMDDYAELSAPGKVTGDERYYYINDIDSARYKNEHTTDPSGTPVALRRYQYLTDDERKIYNYLYASQGKAAADRFLDDLSDTLSERQGAAQYEDMGTLGKALYWIPAGLEQFGSGIKQLFQSEAVPVSPTLITSQLIQQEAQEKSPVLGSLYTLGVTLSNMAPSILTSALGGWALGAAGLPAAAAGLAGSTALGASAGGNAYAQKLREGYSSEAARNYATLVGASEGALQYLLGGIGALSKSGTGRIAAKIAGLDNALGRVARTVSGSTAARLLGSMISEGTEEGLQELLEPAFAAIVFDEEYEANFEDAAYAFLLGALSAGIIEGPAAIDYARRPAGFTFRDMDGYADNGVDYFEGANTLEEVEARYRDLARQYHPDLGGNAATMAEINRQRTMARAFFRGRAEAAAADEAADTTPEAAANTERTDSVIRRLTAGRTTEETTPETAGAQIEDQTYAEAGGIVLPTADSAGDFSPRVEVGETVAPTLEAPRAAVPETNAAGNIVLPTAEEIMNGGISNGQQGQEWQQWGDQVSDGDGGRFSGQRAGVEAGELARGAEQAARPTQQVGTALARQARVRALRLERVSSASLGIENGTEARSLQAIPEAAYDDELRAVSADVYRRTGQRVTFVVGNIQVRAAGKTRAVRGVWTPGGIYVQADNAGYSAAQIAAHEVYHDLAANTPGLDADVKQRIIERYGEDEFRRVAQVYIERLRGVYNVPDGAEHDPELMDKYFASILQEIYADAYAGINAFGAHAERFADPTRETVKERTGIRSRENDDATRDRTGPPAERYSYAGTNAANADLEALEVAKGMAEQNVSAETIRQATGWFQGADGKWRFEIDDSGMRYSARGDLNYGDPDYWRYRELLDKLEREMLGIGSEAVTEAERAEYEELAPRYRDFYLQPGVREDGSATASRLSDYIQHDELFEQYPQLRDARLVFEDMEDGKQGSYNPDTNTITLSESLQNSERDDALVHEIQHAIQEAEGFARGASPQYWARREYESGDLVGERLRREHDNLFRSLSQEEQNQFTRYRELDRELNRTMFAELGTEEAADYERYEAEQDALYDELYSNEWFRKLLDLERRMDDIPGEYRAMYSNTSGEIEARDAEARRKLTADERRAAPPDLGNEDTIFAQSGAGVQASIDYDTDNRPYVTVEEDILDGVPERDWARKVKAVLREKFPDGITVGNSEINIGGRTGRELTWSGTSRWMRANTPVAFADKYRAANNADEILLASTDYVNEGLEHPRRDDIADFSRGKVQFRIGDRDYSADVIVAALNDGRLMLYDITTLQGQKYKTGASRGEAQTRHRELPVIPRLTPITVYPPRTKMSTPASRSMRTMNGRTCLTTSGGIPTGWRPSTRRRRQGILR
ncbi:MAG: LPD23 domain-containing protein [Oscillospiraceae bacterium]